jgi:uncharacterized membrane protein YkoI
LIALPMSMAFAAASCTDKKEIQWTDVPAAVQKTITENAGAGKVKEVKKEIKGGKTIYDADVKMPDGKKIDIEIGEDGTLIEVKNGAD